MITIGERLFLRFCCLLFPLFQHDLPIALVVDSYSQQFRLNLVGHFLCGCSGSTDYFPAMVDVVVVHRNDDIVIFAT